MAAQMHNHATVPTRDDQGSSWPDWKLTLASLPYLTEREAAAAICNLDVFTLDHNPSAFTRYGSVDFKIVQITDLPYLEADLARHQEWIVRNIETGSLKAKLNPKGQTQWAILQTDFAQWCAEQGIKYPLPTPKPKATQADKSRGIIEQCHDEIARLRAKVSELEREKQSLKAQIDQANTESSETDVNRLKRALGALALGLASDAPKWRNRDKPNVSALTEAAIKGVSDERGESPRGYGKTTINGAIKDSIDFCRGELGS